MLLCLCLRSARGEGRGSLRLDDGAPAEPIRAASRCGALALSCGALALACWSASGREGDRSTCLVERAPCLVERRKGAVIAPARLRPRSLEGSRSTRLVSALVLWSASPCLVERAGRTPIAPIVFSTALRVRRAPTAGTCRVERRALPCGARWKRRLIGLRPRDVELRRELDAVRSPLHLRPTRNGATRQAAPETVHGSLVPLHGRAGLPATWVASRRRGSRGEAGRPGAFAARSPRWPA